MKKIVDFIKNLFSEKTINKKTLLIGLLIVFGTIVIDQVSKIYMENLLTTKGTIVVIEDFFKLQLHYNTGAAFSSFDGNFVFLMLMTLVASIVFVFMAFMSDFDTKLFYTIGVFLMIGGMIGNFIDRVFRFGQGVVDFLSFTFFGWDFAVFNMADTFLVIGVICVVIDLLFFEGKREKLKEESSNL